MAGNRGVAQFGRAPGLGPGGRRFESCRSDHLKARLLILRGLFLFAGRAGGLVAMTSGSCIPERENTRSFSLNSLGVMIKGIWNLSHILRYRIRKNSYRLAQNHDLWYNDSVVFQEPLLLVIKPSAYDNSYPENSRKVYLQYTDFLLEKTVTIASAEASRD